MNKTLLEISQTKNGGLSEVLVNWRNYNNETVILALSELKRRNVPINEQMSNLISDFAESTGKPISEVENDFFETKGFEDYEEYYKANNKVLEKTDEEKLFLEKLRRERIIQQEQLTKKEASKDIWVGALWLVGGLLVTVISLSNGHGGVIAYGAVIFGGIQFVRGLMNS